MRHASVFCFCLLLASAVTAPAANADVVLLARGILPGSADMSGLRCSLENGEPGDLLGGLGSGLAYAGGTTFLALPDRGPNAKKYNPAVDDTVSYISRFHTVNMELLPAPPGSSLPFTLNPTLTGTTLLWSEMPLVYGTGEGLGHRIDGCTAIGSGAPSQNTATTFYFTGRSDNFDPDKNSGNPGNARLDPESIRISNDGQSIFISDEYGPYVYQFDRVTGRRIKSFSLPNHFYVSVLSPQARTEQEANSCGRRPNRGMEGLAITPDGKTLVGIMQGPLRQDASKGLLRIVKIDIASGTSEEYGYELTAGSGVSDILAINNDQFLVLERDGTGLGDGSDAKVKRLFKIDLKNAEKITDSSCAAAAKAAVNKTPFLDIVAGLSQRGIARKWIPEKIEGVAFGQDVMVAGVRKHTLYIVNDNDFVPDKAGENQIFVFGFQDSDLRGYMPQQLFDENPNKK